MPKDTALMPETLTLANARLILPEGEMLGRMTITGGEIVEIAGGTLVPAGAVDCSGDIVAPGLVELHTDNLERHLRPRPSAHWPLKPAIAAHDAELAACGITTVYDAIRVGSIEGEGGVGWSRYARDLADALLVMRAAGALKISHHIHLRAEICSETLIAELEQFGPEDRVGIMSLMDHTPGQRQFADIGQYRTYMMGKHGLSEAVFNAHVTARQALGERVRAPMRQQPWPPHSAWALFWPAMMTRWLIMLCARPRMASRWQSFPQPQMPRGPVVSIRSR